MILRFQSWQFWLIAICFDPVHNIMFYFPVSLSGLPCPWGFPCYKTFLHSHFPLRPSISHLTYPRQGGERCLNKTSGLSDTILSVKKFLADLNQILAEIDFRNQGHNKSPVTFFEKEILFRRRESPPWIWNLILIWSKAVICKEYGKKTNAIPLSQKADKKSFFFSPYINTKKEREWRSLRLEREDWT